MFLNLRAEIVRKGMTLEEFARIIGMSGPVLSAKLNGRKEFTYRECVVIKKALGVDIPLETLFLERRDG